MTLDNKFPSLINTRAFNAFNHNCRAIERALRRGKKKKFYFLIAECRVKIEEHLKRNSSIKHKIALMIS